MKKDTMTRFIFFGGLFLIIIFLPKWADSVYGMEAEEFLKELPHEEKTYEEKTYEETAYFEEMAIYPVPRKGYYSVEYHGTGGEGVMEDSYHSLDAYGVLSENKLQKEGYEFVGWQGEKEGAPYYFIDGEGIYNLGKEDGERVHLFAVWKPVGEAGTASQHAEDTTKALFDGNSGKEPEMPPDNPSPPEEEPPSSLPAVEDEIRMAEDPGSQQETRQRVQETMAPTAPVSTIPSGKPIESQVDKQNAKDTWLVSENRSRGACALPGETSVSGGESPEKDQRDGALPSFEDPGPAEMKNNGQMPPEEISGSREFSGKESGDLVRYKKDQFRSRGSTGKEKTGVSEKAFGGGKAEEGVDSEEEDRDKGSNAGNGERRTEGEISGYREKTGLIWVRRYDRGNIPRFLESMKEAESADQGEKRNGSEGGVRNRVPMLFNRKRTPILVMVLTAFTVPCLLLDLVKRMKKVRSGN